MIQIIPAVLATSEEQYINDIRKLSSSEALLGGWVHIDFMDNIFVQNKSIEPEVVRKFPDNFQKEAHLMVEYPKEWIDKLAVAGFKKIIFHIECKDDIAEVIDLIKDKGILAGLALKSETHIERLAAFAGKIDEVLIMSIVAGFQGQKFIPQSLDKVKKIKSKGWNLRIGIDGSVKDDNIKEIINTGVDFVIVGSFLLQDDVDDNLEKLWEEINVQFK